MALSYLLDADICSYAIKQNNDGVRRHFEAQPAGSIAISAISVAELFFGAEVSPRVERDRDLIGRFLTYVEVLPYPHAAAIEYADIRGRFEREGRVIGGNDMHIAAHARSLGLVLVTNNVREFGRVPGLVVENWAE